MLRRIKKDIYKVIAIFIVILFSFAMETHSYELSVNRIKFIKLIEQHFPRYVLRDIEELSPFARNYFKSHYPNFDPSLVHRDFDGNGFEDVAFLLRESKNNDYINIVKETDDGDSFVKFI